MRIGIAVNTDHTSSQEEMGKQFDFTLKCIWQIEAKAIGKLRHPYHETSVQHYLHVRRIEEPKDAPIFSTPPPLIAEDVVQSG